MVEAVDSTQCQEIAEEVLKNVTEHLTEQNKNTLVKTLTISMGIFSSRESIEKYEVSSKFRQLATDEFGKISFDHPRLFRYTLKKMIEKTEVTVAEWVQTLETPFDRLEFCVTLLADSNEVFKENISFDQFRMVSKKAV